MRQLLILLLAPLIFVRISYAAPATLQYQGRIVKSDRTPLEYSNVSFIFQITSASGSCILFEEQVNGYDMTGTDGVFDMPIGLGAKSFPADPNFTVTDSFSDDATFACKGGLTYTPGVTDGRRLRVHFHDGSGWRTILPDNFIRSVPYASYASSAAKLNGLPSSAFIVKTGIPNCAAGTFLSWNGSALSCQAVSGIGNSGLADDSVTSAKILDGTIATADLANSAVTDVKISGVGVGKVGSGAGQYFTYAPNNVACATGQILKWQNSRWECANETGGGAESDPTVAAFSKNTPSADFSTPGDVLTLNTIAISKGGTGATTRAGGLNALLPSQGSQAGKILTTDGANATWENAPASGSVSSVNVAIPNMTSSGAVTSSGTVTMSYTSQAQNSVLAAPLVGAGAPSFRTLQIADIKSSAGGAFLTGGACAAGSALVYTSANDTISCQSITASGTAGGDLSGSYPSPSIAALAVDNGKLAANAVTSDKILDGTISTNDIANVAITDAKIANVAVSKVASGAGHYFTYAPNGTACTAGQILKWQNSHWECASESGVGSESDPTVAAFSKNTPSADFTTPGDVLTLGTVSIAKGGTGATTQAAALTALLPAQGSNSGKVLQTNGTTATWETPAAPDLSGYVAKTGDTMNGALNLPTNGLVVGTNELVVSGGNIGVGTNAPSHPLHIRSNIDDLKGLRIDNANSGSSAGPMFEMINDIGTRGVMFVGSSNHPAPYANRLTFENIEGDATGITFMSSSATGDIRWYAGGDSAGFERMRVLPSGNIGIGITNPTEKLDVGGKVKATEFCIGGSCLSSWPSPGGSGTVTQVSTGTGLTGGPINSTGTISIASGGVSATELASNAVTTVKILDNNVTPAKLETVPGLVANVYGGATKVPVITVDTKGRVTAGSEVSIVGLLPTPSNGKFAKSGASAWTAEFITFQDIKNSLGATALTTTGCTANQTLTWSSLTDSFTCQSIGSLDASKITTGVIANNVLPASAKLWKDGGSNRVYYDSGYVGVGTSTPQEQLDVKSANRNWIRSVSTGSTTDDNMGFQAVNYMNGHANGPTFWGVNYRGTEAAPAALQANDMLISLGASGGRDNAWNVNMGAFFKVNATENFTATAAGSKMTFYTATNGTLTNQERMVIDHNGNVGIGTATPAVALDVNGKINGNQSYVTLTDGATVTWALAGIINNAVVTLAGNRTLALSGLTNGMSGTIIVKQDGVGNRTLTLPTACTNKVIGGGGGVVTLTTSANSIDILAFTYDGTNCYWTYGKNYN